MRDSVGLCRGALPEALSAVSSLAMGKEQGKLRFKELFIFSPFFLSSKGDMLETQKSLLSQANLELGENLGNLYVNKQL